MFRSVMLWLPLNSQLSSRGRSTLMYFLGRVLVKGLLFRGHDLSEKAVPLWCFRAPFVHAVIILWKSEARHSLLWGTTAQLFVGYHHKAFLPVFLCVRLLRLCTLCTLIERQHLHYKAIGSLYTSKISICVCGCEMSQCLLQRMTSLFLSLSDIRFDL